MLKPVSRKPSRNRRLCYSKKKQYRFGGCRFEDEQKLWFQKETTAQITSGIKERKKKSIASSKDYLNFILEQLHDLENITYRAMMGEFILYYKGRIAGGIYDDRLLIKPVPSAIAYMPEARYELPYEGAKKMLLADNVDDKEYLTGLFEAIYEELPAPKLKKKKTR